MKNSDTQLIHRVLNGDENAFSALVEKYQKQVHVLAWRKIGDFHIAEEITYYNALILATSARVQACQGRCEQHYHLLENPHFLPHLRIAISPQRCNGRNPDSVWHV